VLENAKRQGIVAVERCSHTSAVRFWLWSPLAMAAYAIFLIYCLHNSHKSVINFTIFN